MKRVYSLVAALALTGCGVAPAGPVAPFGAADAGMSAQAKASVGTAFEQALEAKYGALYVPAGAKARLTKVETYKIQGGQQRVRAVVVVEAPRFTAELAAMAGLGKGDKVTIDYFPSFQGATTGGEKADVEAACAYAVRIQRLDRAQLGKGKLADAVDPAKYDVKVLLFGAKERDLAEVSYQCEGFLGKGSTFTEFYRVNGKRGPKTTITGVTYNDNKATDPNGNDLDT